MNPALWLQRAARHTPDAPALLRGADLVASYAEFAARAAVIGAGLRERGILAVKSGENVLRLLPPLVVKRSEMKRLLDALGEVLAGGAGA